MSTWLHAVVTHLHLYNMLYPHIPMVKMNPNIGSFGLNSWVFKVHFHTLKAYVTGSVLASTMANIQLVKMNPKIGTFGLNSCVFKAHFHPLKDYETGSVLAWTMANI